VDAPDEEQGQIAVRRKQCVLGAGMQADADRNRFLARPT
jgi:hypothetical protein